MLSNTQHYWLSVGLWLGVLMSAFRTAKNAQKYDSEIQDFNSVFLGQYAKTAYYRLNKELHLSEKEILGCINQMLGQSHE